MGKGRKKPYFASYMFLKDKVRKELLVRDVKFGF